MSLAQLGAAWQPLLEREVGAFGLSARADAAFFARATTYLDRLVEWNARIDLTAAREPEELVDLTFADAAALARSGALRPGERWVDVGSGMGAPGVALALFEPSLAITLVDSRAKRTAFLRTLGASLPGLGIEVRRERSERLAEAAWAVAISRATLPPPNWLREGIRLAEREVWVLLAREAPPSVPGWSAVNDFAFDWPLSGRQRRAVAYQPTRAL
jgi:16S rRNA (guanine527-N7)-methyltransferase